MQILCHLLTCKWGGLNFNGKIKLILLSTGGFVYKKSKSPSAVVMAKV